MRLRHCLLSTAPVGRHCARSLDGPRLTWPRCITILVVRLTEAVLARRLLPLNAERIRRLETYQKEAGRKKVRLENIIEAMVGPALRLSRDENKRGRIFMRLLGRLVLEPDARIQNLLTGQFETVLKKFMPSLTVALPHLSPEDFFWRLHFFGRVHGAYHGRFRAHSVNLRRYV